MIFFICVRHNYPLKGFFVYDWLRCLRAPEFIKYKWLVRGFFSVDYKILILKYWSINVSKAISNITLVKI
jgi:hypothetical protein